jgi:hypothetical protein
MRQTGTSGLAILSRKAASRGAGIVARVLQPFAGRRGELLIAPHFIDSLDALANATPL